MSTDNPSGSGSQEHVLPKEGFLSMETFSAVLDSKFDSLKRELAGESSLQISSAYKKAKLTPKWNLKSILC